MTYTITDKFGLTATAKVFVTIEGVKAPTLNQAPVAEGDAAIINEDSSILIDVLANDSDPDGNPLRLVSVGQSQNGQASIQSSQIFYQPNPDFNGIETFSYTVTDEIAQVEQWVTVTILAVNDAPLAKNDSLTTVIDQAISGNVLTNDIDVDGDIVTVVSHDSVSAQGGSVSVQANGAFIYTPKIGFLGSDSFSYSVADGFGGSSSAQVSIQVQDESAPPYYITGLIFQEWRRFNYPDPLGTKVSVTFCFLSEVPSYYDPEAIGDSFLPFTEQQKDETRKVIQHIQTFSGLVITETPCDEAGITFGKGYFGGFDGGGYFPNRSGIGTTASDVWLDPDFAGDVLIPGTRPYQILMHELGHAMGLDHPDLPEPEKNHKYSIMASMGHPTLSGLPSEYKLYDIATLQYLYGRNESYHSSDNIYSTAELMDSREVI